MSNKKKITIVVVINLAIFVITNLLFNIKYEQVDDFIIYNLYSGLDGTYNIHGIYIYPIICFVLGLFFRVIPTLNWHSIFLLFAQFVCFTLIGYTILKKYENKISIALYTVFAGFFYTTLLMLIQYTSVAALLILTSFIMFIDIHEENGRCSLKYKVLTFTLFSVGFMIRMQSLIIIIPFMGIYLISNLINVFKNKNSKKDFLRLIKYYTIYLLITVLIYISSLIIYNSNKLYKEYMEYNSIRATLHDIKYVSYVDNKEIFDEIGWTENDHYLFYTFNFGDESKYSKENLKKILDYTNQKEGNFRISQNIFEIFKKFILEEISTYTYITLFFYYVFIVSLFISKEKRRKNLLVFITTIAVHIFFIAIGRSMQRVVIPEYIISTAMLLCNLNISKKEKVSINIKNVTAICVLIFALCYMLGTKYNYGYKLKNYESTRNLIEYTNQNKQNVYLYTVPSLQFRYLAYSVYKMPPKESFSNLRVIGGWDMFTKNYYDFKERYNLDGNLLDLLKENVYLVDGDVVWSGIRYDNYKQNVILAIKENYNIDVEYELTQEFDNLKIYKLRKK